MTENEKWAYCAPECQVLTLDSAASILSGSSSFSTESFGEESGAWD